MSKEYESFQQWFECEFPYIGRKYELSSGDLVDAFTAGRALGRREMKGECKNIVKFERSERHKDVESVCWYIVDAIEAISEEVQQPPQTHES